MLLAIGVNVLVYRRGRALIRLPDEVSPAAVVLVFGAYVHPDGTPCPAVEDRLMTALELYRTGKARKFLLSGDHGRDDYDEVNGMRRYLEAQGVPGQHLFLDHAGFDTYNSLLRARDVFGASDIILVTQEFHLTRALYIARALGMTAQGVAADRRVLRDIERLKWREVGARLKAFAEVTSRRSPRHRGPAVDLEGDAMATHDKD